MRHRSKVRVGLKVIHRHRVGLAVFRRVSELVYVHGRPKALLGWINIGGLRTPIYICDLDPVKLRPAGGERGKNTFYYDEITVDPRYEDVAGSGLLPDVAHQDDQDESHSAGRRR
jgi:hypothetical protein